MDSHIIPGSLTRYSQPSAVWFINYYWRGHDETLIDLYLIPSLGVASSSGLYMSLGIPSMMFKVQCEFLGYTIHHSSWAPLLILWYSYRLLQKYQCNVIKGSQDPRLHSGQYYNHKPVTRSVSLNSPYKVINMSYVRSFRGIIVITISGSGVPGVSIHRPKTVQFNKTSWSSGVFLTCLRGKV